MDKGKKKANTEKIYAIYGADRNTGIPPDVPFLGYAQGEYEDVLAYAKTLEEWVCWNPAETGHIYEIHIKKIKKNKPQSE